MQNQDLNLKGQGLFGLKAWLFLSLLTLLMFVLAQSLPLVKTSFWGFWGEQRHFLSLIIQSFQQGHYWMASLALLLGFIIPLVSLLIQVYLLIGLHYKHEMPGFQSGLRLLAYLRPWSMVPVFFLGLLVALVKVAEMQTIDLQWGLWAYLSLAILLMTMQGLHPQRLVGLAQQQGVLVRPEDGLNPWARNSCSTMNTPSLNWSTLIPVFLLCAFIFFILANIWPMMQISTLLNSQAYTLWQGVVNLWHAEMRLLASLIFSVSLFFPLMKILVLAVLYWQVRNEGLQGKQQLFWYKALKLTAQWSMLDVVVVLLLGVMLNFGFILSIKPMEGTLYYTLMVVSTVLASICFRVRPANPVV